MKAHISVNIEHQVVELITNLLGHLPMLTVDAIMGQDAPGVHDAGIDLRVTGRIGDKPLVLALEIKGSGQPRYVRDAAYRLHRYIRDHDGNAVPVVVAPYFSPQARETCREERLGYLDLHGNARIAFDTVYIEREVPGRPAPENREIRSLYKPRSARVLRALLASPGKAWRSLELAEQTGVSIGLISQVSRKLRAQDWAAMTDGGLILHDPDALLDNWTDHYEPPRGQEHRCYTPFEGEALTERLRSLELDHGRIALACYSAAEWLAPYTRHPSTYLYADTKGFAALENALALSPAPRGANIVIMVPEDDGVLADASPVADGLCATSPVQTYLDLMRGGDRGREGAEHLRRTLLGWQA